jgi:hypothetical protein
MSLAEIEDEVQTAVVVEMELVAKTVLAVKTEVVVAEEDGVLVVVPEALPGKAVAPKE